MESGARAAQPGGQALHRRGWRQGEPAPRAAPRRSGRAGGHVDRPRARTHRGDGGQARGDPGIPPGVGPRSCGAAAGALRNRSRDRHRRHRAGRPQALRAARPDRDGRFAAADRRLHPVEEARHGCGGDRLRRQSRRRGLPATPRPGERARRAARRDLVGARDEGRGTADRHESTARRLGRARERDPRGARLSRRRRAARDDRAHPRPRAGARTADRCCLVGVESARSARVGSGT